MANFILSYDLNGPNPSHKQMDEHLEKLGVARGRVLETVWYVGGPTTRNDLFDHVRSILSSNDQLIVVEAKDATWVKLLVTSQSLKQEWENNRS